MTESIKPDSWEPFRALCRETVVPADFMAERPLNEFLSWRDPFEGWDTEAETVTPEAEAPIQTVPDHPAG